MEVNGNIILDETQDILIELRKQLSANGFIRFDKIIVSGQNLQTNCPFHKDGREKKPSFGIHTKTGECHCFGCGWSGTFAEMVSACFGKNDFGVFGTKWLAKNFLTLQVEERSDLDLNIDRRVVETTAPKYVSDEELDSYRFYHPYMYKRKLTNEIIELFDIGYDRVSDCITFPVRDINGNTLFVARRSVNSKFFNYPAGAEKPVYGLYEIKKCFEQGVPTEATLAKTWNNAEIKEILYYPAEIIICESMIDALTCWVYGKYAVALNGLGNDLQIEQLNKMPCRKFIIATDMDEAGLRARQRLKSRLKNKIVTEYYWDLSVAKDINDMDKRYFESLREFF